ncbi:hypothetical protein C4D60_Mb05t00330 [Musa balbisiana]|uniref:Uncharacterized protein n=1 Tax=Musa balbisiana TaxID=52838 RepID=A0A4S8JSP9_MUSBA|nr:hypothetical protein C4D60_Mb05t00330 [Musa balbisiana]
MPRTDIACVPPPRFLRCGVETQASHILHCAAVPTEFMVPSAYIPELPSTMQWRKSRNMMLCSISAVSDSYESRAQYSDPKSTCLMKKWHQFTTKVQ